MKADRNDIRLRPGDVVEIRSPAEILATLDEAGALDALPFMPEMLQFAGKRFTVSKKVLKICDTIQTGGLRRMRDTVFLEDLRCDGTAHGGCQAQCRIYWKEAWLGKVESRAVQKKTRSAVTEAESAKQMLNRLAWSNTRINAHQQTVTPQGAEIFRCQATEAFRATEPIPPNQKLIQYIREVSTGNVSLRHFLRVVTRALIWKSSFWRNPNRIPKAMSFTGSSEKRDKLELQPSEWVEVLSSEDIGRTLDSRGKNKGLGFSPAEMLPFCGKKFQVKRRVDRIIDERSGKMLVFKNDCIVLEGIACAGDRSTGRWFCPRGLYPYWREAWLRRVDRPLTQSKGTAPGAIAARK